MYHIHRGRRISQTPGAAVTAIYESDRHDRRYEVDARGVAEFGRDRILQRFIPWGAVHGIELSHDRRHTQVRWSVKSADGSRIRPKLEYTNSLECYNDAIRAWRACVPHGCREHFRRVYGQARLARALVHLFWLIPALCVYGVFGLAYALHADVDWQDIGPMSTSIAIMYVCCIAHTWLFHRELRLGFDRWYTLKEASFTEPAKASPAPCAASSAGYSLHRSPIPPTLRSVTRSDGRSVDGTAARR